MLKAQEEFHSFGGKRRILVADDERINREMLGAILEEEYEVLFARDGREALDVMREQRETLSLVLLDLMMPAMSGLDLLRCVREEPAIQKIPIIVLTSDQTAEIESLNLGAIDFIPKPYPQAGVILARVLRTIELSEERDTIQYTERDPLTGLYNREFFYHYAEQFDQHHRNTPMDAIVLDVNHFHMINERYGKTYGDQVLRRIGEKVRSMVQGAGGIVCRRGGDTFMVYCPHRTDYKAILESAAVAVTGDGEAGSRVRLRMGVYSDVDKSIDIERRFDRAKSASDTVRNSFTRTIAMYDETLHEAELYSEQLIEDFQKAIQEQQFTVYYQPKFDIRSAVPVLTSAEALVRWKHPELGMISPGVFIPLFEENGLIQELDTYVWRKAAKQIRDWRDRFGISVPVSVNVSRIDMYDPCLVEEFQALLSAHGLKPREFLLEITESAYTQDSAQIIGTVNRLRSLGFQIEMDDFGTGYSSLNMISSLPIDALKLDMKFIRDAFRDGGDTRLIEVIIDIADYLSVPVIAEGVETEEQLNALKAMGCDIVQGYYFSKPVPAEEFERFVEEKKRRIETDAQAVREMAKTGPASGRGMSASIAKALSSDYENIYFVDMATGEYVEFTAQSAHERLHIEASGSDFFSECQKNLRAVVYAEDQPLVSEALKKENLKTALQGAPVFTLLYRLITGGAPTYYQMRVAQVGNGGGHIVIGVSNVAAQIAREKELEESRRENVTYSRISQALAADYCVIYYVDLETDRFIEYSSHEDYRQLGIETGGEDFFGLSRRNCARVVHPDDLEMVLAVLTKEKMLEEMEASGAFTLTYRLIFGGKPTYVSLKATRMTDREDHHMVVGVSNVDAQMRREQELADVRSHINRDALTGVKSKHAYVEMEDELNQRIAAGEAEPFAVAVCDVNDLKPVNDSRGHAAGDQLLRSAAMRICNIFKHSPVFRCGGDEFVVLMRGHDWEKRAELMEELNRKNAERGPGGAVIASGISDYLPGKDSSVADVFARADAAMYERKSRLKGAR